MSKILKFFDLLEDKIRGKLSRWPIVYAIVGITGVVLIWRGIWYLLDISGLSPFWSLVAGIAVLLSSGLLVALSIGDEIIISAFRGRKKITEVSLEETLTLTEKVDEIKKLLNGIETKLGTIKKEEKKIGEEISEIKN